MAGFSFTQGPGGLSLEPAAPAGVSKKPFFLNQGGHAENAAVFSSNDSEGIFYRANSPEADDLPTLQHRPLIAVRDGDETTSSGLVYALFQTGSMYWTPGALTLYMRVTGNIFQSGATVPGLGFSANGTNSQIANNHGLSLPFKRIMFGQHDRWYKINGISEGSFRLTSPGAMRRRIGEDTTTLVPSDGATLTFDTPDLIPAGAAVLGVAVKWEGGHSNRPTTVDVGVLGDLKRFIDGMDLTQAVGFSERDSGLDTTPYRLYTANTPIRFTMALSNTQTSLDVDTFVFYHSLPTSMDP